MTRIDDVRMQGEMELGGPGEVLSSGAKIGGITGWGDASFLLGFGRRWVVNGGRDGGEC